MSVPERLPAVPATAVILVVEDNATTRKMMRVALSSQGFSVMEAGDGASAIEMMQRSLPDLVLQDLLLPDMDGFELVEKLRAIPGAASVPILACSGFLSRSDDARATAAGFTDLIVKPVEPSRLVETVRAHLPDRSQLSTGTGRRVLVVDDDPLQRKLTRVHLASRGYTILEAQDGVEALEVARRELPDAIVSDVLMPQLDGFALCAEVRRDPRLATAPVILISANYSDEADRRLALDSGANDLVVRSPDYRDLVEALEEGLQGQTPTVTLPPPSPLDHDHLHRVIRQLERQAAMNSGLAQRCSLQAAELSVLSGISEALASSRNIDDALDDVLSSCLDAGGLSLGALYLIGPDGQLRVRAFSGTRDPANLERFFREEPRLLELITSRATVTIPSPQLTAEISQKILESSGLKSALVVPLSAREEPLGALLMASRDRDLGEEDWPAFARTVANQIGQAVALTRAFSRVAASEQRFRTLVDSMNDLVFLLDCEQRFADVHGGLASVQELSPSALIGRPISALLGPAASRAHLRAVDQAQAGESAVYEWSLDSAEGLLHFQTSLAPMKDASGNLQGVVGVARDITEQKRMQAQLMVSDRMASIGALAAGVAHEINNPLASVMANLELATRGLEEIAQSGAHEEELKDLRLMLKDAREGATRVRRIVGDLKLFSRAEDEQRGPVDVREVMESTLRMAWNEIRHRARVVKEYRTVPLVLANESRLGQVFLNLVINAAQAIPEGKADEHEIRVSISPDREGRVVIAVEDTGTGMPPETLRQVFDPFFTTKPAGVGVGLGLSICQRLVNAMGGEISADSFPGKGTVFRVVLPPSLEDQSSCETIPPPPAVPRAKRAARILVVDDEKMIGSAIRRMLSRDHDVKSLDNAQEALDRIAGGERYDLILCDLMMPVVTGMDFYWRLSEMSPEQAEKVVFLTGGAFTASAREFLDEVENPHLEKPFDLRSLETLVQERLAR